LKTILFSCPAFVFKLSSVLTSFSSLLSGSIHLTFIPYFLVDFKVRYFKVSYE
jgi:hypothetical protein